MEVAVSITNPHRPGGSESALFISLVRRFTGQTLHKLAERLDFYLEFNVCMRTDLMLQTITILEEVVKQAKEKKPAKVAYNSITVNILEK